eukprot:m.45759 g.45759  ORF g.45759 m.45759 type:complete len:373 (-) comp6262_c1_seq2:199-1317(-)
MAAPIAPLTPRMPGCEAIVCDHVSSSATSFCERPSSRGAAPISASSTASTSSSTSTAACAAHAAEMRIAGPPGSAYEGAEFAVRVETTTDGRTGAVSWCSPIYHPLLVPNQRVCPCRLAGAQSAASVLDAIAGALADMLARPHLHPPCPSCPTNPQALAELRADPAFFARKARAATPGTAPFPDDDLRRLAAADEGAMDFSRLLTSGVFSDVKLIVGRSAFKCHRTVLAAQSPVLRHYFETTADHGRVVVPSARPHVFGRFLQHIYSGRLFGLEEIDADEHFELLLLASRYRVERLYQYEMVLASSLLCEDTAIDFALLASAYGSSLTSHVVAFVLERRQHLLTPATSARIVATDSNLASQLGLSTTSSARS